jgi:hypothetical protein
LWLTAILAMVPAAGHAEWQLAPFAGVSFGGGTTFVDFDQQAGKPKFNFGGRGLLLGEIFGVEADFGLTPGYFSGNIIQSSHVLTLTGNLVVALPKRLAQYSLRPYVAAGGGWMHVGTSDIALPFSKGLRAVDFGGGVTGFFNDHIGVNWDLRFFRSLHGSDDVSGISIGPEELSTWRVTMGFVFRP